MMTKLPIAVQVYSVRDDAARDFAGTMKQIKEMGYDGVELAGMYGKTAGEIREILDATGLKAVSAHVGLLNGELSDAEKLMDDSKAIGCDYVAVPYLPEELRPLTPGFATVMEKLPKLGEMASQKGLTLLYHNHDFEFVKMENGEYGLDYMYSHVSPKLLQTELDTCWINVGGEDPAAYVRKYAGRCPLVHLKDFYMKGKKPSNMYELIGIDSSAEEKPDRSTFDFRPVGHGLQDIPSIVQAAEESGAKWLVVEQDRSSERPPMEAVRMSIEYLKK